MIDRVARIGGDGLAEETLCCLAAIGLERDEAEKMERIRMLRVLFENAFEAAFRGRHVALEVGAGAGVEFLRGDAHAWPSDRGRRCLSRLRSAHYFPRDVALKGSGGRPVRG